MARNLQADLVDSPPEQRADIVRAHIELAVASAIEEVAGEARKRALRADAEADKLARWSEAASNKARELAAEFREFANSLLKATQAQCEPDASGPSQSTPQR